MKKRIRIARVGRNGRNFARLPVHMQGNIDYAYDVQNYMGNWPRRRYLAPPEEVIAFVKMSTRDKAVPPSL